MPLAENFCRKNIWIFFRYATYICINTKYKIMYTKHILYLLKISYHIHTNVNDILKNKFHTT